MTCQACNTETTSDRTLCPRCVRPRCVICRREQDDWRPCPGCVTRVDRMLGELVDLHALASQPEALIPPTTGNEPRGSSGKEPPIGLDVAALDLAHGEVLLSTDDSVDPPPWMGLETWERDWREVLGLGNYGDASSARLSGARSRATAQEVTLVGCVAFLRSAWPLAAERHPAADEFAADIRRMWHHARNALRIPITDQEPPAFVIACPGDHGGRPCGQRLPVHAQPLPPEGQAPNPVSLNCPRCGSRWNLDRLLLVARATLTEVWVSADQAATALRVDRRTIYRMAGRGEISQHLGRFNIGGGVSIGVGA